MTSIDHGMSVSDVEALGRKLQDTYAAQIKDFVAQIEKMVSSSAQHWVGKDGNDFRSWWPAKRTKLNGIAEDLHGYGQSALNNAHEQTTASDGVSGGTGAAAAGAVAAGTAAAGGAASAAPSATVAVGAGADAGVLDGSHRTWEEAKAAYDSKYHTYGLYGDGAPGAENQYQCVSWAWFRMRELGYQGAQVPAWGGAMAKALGGTTDTAPHLGAVMSYGGHVVIAEEITKGADGRMTVRVSEMNSGNDGSGIEASASEYMNSNTFIRSADGAWTSADGRSRSDMTVFNPAYPS